MAGFKSVNWFRRNIEASSIYYAPESLLSVYKTQKTSALTPTANLLSCPAVVKRRADLFIVRCPYDLRLRYVGPPGEGAIHVVHPGTSIVDSKLKSIFTLSAREDWADPNVPVAQLSTPYVFTSEEPVDVIQLNNPMDFGLATGFRLIEGQFPVDRWLRPLSFAFEWLDTDRDICFKRGQPWFALQFRSREDYDAKIKLSEVEETPELANLIRRNANVTSYIKGTSKLFTGD